MPDTNFVCSYPQLRKDLAYHTRRLIGRAGYTISDTEDVRQELLLDLWCRSKRFDPAKSSVRTFANRVMRHKVATLVRASGATKRDYLKTRHLEQCALPSDSSVEGRIHRRVDVRTCIDCLPTSLRTIAITLMTRTVVQASSELGISRTTLHRRILEIQQAFELMGLGPPGQMRTTPSREETRQ